MPHTLDRIDELEIRLSFQDQLLHTLNEVVTAQHHRLEALQAQVLRLQTELQRVQSGGGEPGVVVDERPPHY